MNPKIAAGAAAPAFIASALVTSLAAAGPALAENWRCYGCPSNYVYAQRYVHVPPYGYCGGYAAYCGAYEGPWRYHGGPHPSAGHL
jgi:hypothetical protein